MTIKKSEEFRLVYGKGKSAGDKYLAIYVMENAEGCGRFGIVVSKKVGKAVCRNKIRRRLKEALRLIFADYVNKRDKARCLDIVVVARRAAPEADFARIRTSLTRLLNKAGVSA